jgi:hypothetical protein
MRTLQVISPRRIPSRSRLVNVMKRVYLQRCSPPSLRKRRATDKCREAGAGSRYFWLFRSSVSCLRSVVLVSRVREHYRHRSIHLDGHPTHQGRLISPLQYGLDRRVHEISRTGNISGAIDSTVLTDDYVKDNGTVNALASNRRVQRRMHMQQSPSAYRVSSLSVTFRGLIINYPIPRSMRVR